MHVPPAPVSYTFRLSIQACELWCIYASLYVFYLCCLCIGINDDDDDDDDDDIRAELPSHCRQGIVRARSKTSKCSFPPSPLSPSLSPPFPCPFLSPLFPSSPPFPPISSSSPGSPRSHPFIQLEGLGSAISSTCGFGRILAAK